MSNPTLQYEHLIESLCRTAGIDGWREIADSRHMMVDERLIGLVPDVDRDPPTLSIYMELGQTYADEDATLYARMLQANLAPPDELPGHFGLHPQTRQAVYSLTLGLDEIDGTQLASLLESQIELSRTAMDRLAAPV